MDMTNWLPLTEYSIKHKVSLSTLRRRIKSDNIKYTFQDGKYFLLDESVSSHSKHRPSQIKDDAKNLVVVEKEIQPRKVVEVATKSEKVSEPSSAPKSEERACPPKKEFISEEPMITTANKLLTELKKAYSQILQEKEEQILQLKEEVSDLRTLVRVLESENERAKNQMAIFRTN